MNLLLYILLFSLVIGIVVLIVSLVDNDQTTPITKKEQANLKGQQGEKEVQRILSRLPRTEYVVLNDVLLPAENGTTQIDHIVVSLYGIFVIEPDTQSGSRRRRRPR